MPSPIPNPFEPFPRRSASWRKFCIHLIPAFKCDQPLCYQEYCKLLDAEYEARTQRQLDRFYGAKP